MDSNAKTFIALGFCSHASYWRHQLLDGRRPGLIFACEACSHHYYGQQINVVSISHQMFVALICCLHVLCTNNYISGSSNHGHKRQDSRGFWLLFEIFALEASANKPSLPWASACLRSMLALLLGKTNQRCRHQLPDGRRLRLLFARALYEQLLETLYGTSKTVFT